MKRLLFLVLVGAILLNAIPALAQDGFYVIAGSGKAGTPISSVPYIISASGMYYLNGNLTSTSTTQHGITIAANDVTLDLMGFSLTGPGKTSGSGNCGIKIAGSGSNNKVDNVEIRNGSVRSFGQDGISATESCTGIRVIGLRARDNGGAGVSLGGLDHLVTGCSLLNNASIGATIVQGKLKGNNVFHNGEQGLSVGSGSTVSGNVCQLNLNTGINTASGCTVVDNTVMSSGFYGIFTQEGCTIMRNTSRANSDFGIRTGSNCTIINNTTQGFLTVGGTNSIVLENTIY
jgi:hypothetical protein